jgi:hypothetical protein
LKSIFERLCEAPPLSISSAHPPRKPTTMSAITFQVPRQHPPRHARPGVDLPISELQQMIEANQVGSFIACEHIGTPFDDHWFLYAMGRASTASEGECLGLVTLYADRPLAIPTIDAVVEILHDVGFDGLLSVAAEPMPLEG